MLYLYLVVKISAQIILLSTQSYRQSLLLMVMYEQNHKCQIQRNRFSVVLSQQRTLSFLADRFLLTVFSTALDTTCSGAASSLTSTEYYQSEDSKEDQNKEPLVNKSMCCYIIGKVVEDLSCSSGYYIKKQLLPCKQQGNLLQNLKPGSFYFFQYSHSY